MNKNWLYFISIFLEETKPAGFISFDTEYWKDTDTATPKLKNIPDEVQ